MEYPDERFKRHFSRNTRETSARASGGFKFCRRLLVLLAVPILFSAPAPAATIEGTVVDPSGRPAPRIVVTLMRGPIPIEQIRSGARGDYQFRGLRAGEYQLVASGSGLSAAPVTVRISSAHSAEKIGLRLELSAVRQRVVVSASLGGSLASEAGSSVSVISHQKLVDQGVQNVYEALRELPGVAVNQTGRLGGVTSVFVRGGNSNYNLVMVDGVEVDEFGGDFDFASIPADGVERVEVVRDPESALYGSDAVTGVIDVISRRGSGSPHFNGVEEVGSNWTRRFATGGEGETLGINWSYDLSRLDTDGVVQNDQYRDQSAFLTLDEDSNPRRQINFHFFGNANDAGAPGPYGSDPDHLFTGIDTISRDKQNLFAFGGNYTQELSPRFRETVSAALAINDYYFRSPYGDSFSNNLRGDVRGVSEMTFSSRDYLAAGLEYDREQIDNTYIADSNNHPFLLPRTDFAYFAENRWSPDSRLFVNAGLRLDGIDTHALPAGAFGLRPLLPASSIVQADPRVSVAYLARENSGQSAFGLTRFHASFGTGIRPPDGFELAFTNNRQLKPERNLGFDAGAEQRFFGDKMILNATYFYNRFEDQIVVLGGSLTHLSSFISANLGNSRADGMEFSAEARPAASLSVSGEYTLLSTSILALNGSDLALAPFHVGQPLVRRPKNSGSFDVTWSHHRLMLNANAYIRGSVLDTEPNYGLGACTLTDANGNPLNLPCLFTNRGYTLVNAGFAYQFPVGVEIYGRLNNVLDQKYEESLGYPALRLNFLAGLRFNIPPKH